MEVLFGWRPRRMEKGVPKGIARFSVKCSNMKRLRAVTVFLLIGLCSAPAQEAEISPVLVEADRLPDADVNAALAADVVTKEELTAAPQLRLDDILRNEVPGFSLFRRSSSRVAN